MLGENHLIIFKEDLKRLRGEFVGRISEGPHEAVTAGTDREPHAAPGSAAKAGPKRMRLAKSQIEAELRRVEAAIARIESGTFGSCCRCGFDVEREMLESDPATPFCRTCIEEFNAQRQRQRNKSTS